MVLYMWQDDNIGVAHFIDACLEKCMHQLALPWGTRHLIGPELAGKELKILLLCPSIMMAHTMCSSMLLAPNRHAPYLAS